MLFLVFNRMPAMLTSINFYQKAEHMKVSIKKSKLDSQVKMFVFWNLIFEINLTPSIKIDSGSFCCISVHVLNVNSHEKHPTVMLYLSFKLSNMFPC